MAGKGPPKTPTGLLELRGSWRAKTRTKEPTPVATGLTCPAWLEEDGKKVWRGLVKHLKAMGIVGSVDAVVLGRYCQLWCRWLAAELEIRATGSYIATLDRDGEINGKAIAPAVKVAGDLADKLLRLEQQYGMTPSARASLSVTAPKKADKPAETIDKAQFFKKRA